MSVVKRKRKESPFEVFHHLTKLRQNMDELYEDLKKEKYERSKQC